MQKSLLSFVIFLLVFNISSFSQNRGVDQGFGLLGSKVDISGLARLRTDSSAIDAQYSMRVKQIGIVYSIRKDLIKWRWGSVSVGSPMMLGISFTNRYRSIDFDGAKRDTITGKKGGHIAFEIPVVADLNIGLHSASDDSRRSLGIYVGAGYQYSYSKVHTSVGKVPFDSFDPVLRAGMRMGKSWETRWSLGFNMRGVSGGHRTYSIHWLKEL
ncbi:MAG: hypothetical protein ACOYVG_06215 [Bacteroidota bacterium]